MGEDLRSCIEDTIVSIAIRGQLDGYLAPHLWEELRIRLQRVYRKATGEQLATLHISNEDRDNG